MALSELFGPRTGHKPLFSDLCRFHDVDRKTHQLLRSVADRLQLERPSELFVDPTLLQKAMQLSDFASNSDELQELCKSWFGQ